MGFCSNPLDKHHVGDVVNELGVVRLMIGILYALMAVLTIFWIHLQERIAQTGSSGAVKSVIFPIFTKMMWLSAFSSVLLALLMIFVPVHLTHGANGWIGELAYPIAFTLQHAVMEGIAFLLMNKGCGNHAAKNTLKYVGIWCSFTFVVTLSAFHEHSSAIYLFYTWDIMQLLFYLALWLAPLNHLYRRPAAYPYACFWFWFRVLEISFYSLSYAENSRVQSIGHCGYVFGPLLIFTLFQPLVCYYTLLSDSNWWQGFGVGEDDRSTPGSINSPMWGMDLTLHSAQTLARTLDEMRNTGSAKLVNFAHIALDTQKLIGQGSFSRVYSGTYKMQKCAIKLVYSLDLTSEEINKVAAEATLLNSVQHKHVVHIYGVSVLPPSVCILLELCAYGSLSDVLRGSTSNVNKALTLSYLDKMYLALGCARGLAALHSMGPTLVHRDIKSFNFLVDAQLNAKLADLELGMDSQNVEIDAEGLLPNWAAPEVLLGQPYTQASDVYSLSLVLWEILSGVIPYGEIEGTSIEKFKYIRSEVAELQHRLDIPAGCEHMAPLVQAGWHSDSTQRPSALSMVHSLTEIWRAVSVSECVTNLLCEVMPAAVTDTDTNTDTESTPSSKSNNNTTVVGKNISQILQAWYASSDYKKHIQTMTSTSITVTQISDTNSNGKLSQPPSSACSGLCDPKLGGRLYVREHSSEGMKTTPEGPGLEMLLAGNTTASASATPSVPLQRLYDAISEHPDWRHLAASSPQPLLVITRCPPHVIVSASDAWCRLTGYKAVQVFGHSLDEFLVLDSKKKSKNKNNKSDSDASDKPFGNNMQALKAFYEEVCEGGLSRSKSRSLFTRTSTSSLAVSGGGSSLGGGGGVDLGESSGVYGHALVSIHRASTHRNQRPLPLSLHGFPVTLPEVNVSSITTPTSASPADNKNYNKNNGEAKNSDVVKDLNTSGRSHVCGSYSSDQVTCSNSSHLARSFPPTNANSNTDFCIVYMNTLSYLSDLQADLLVETQVKAHVDAKAARHHVTPPLPSPYRTRSLSQSDYQTKPQTWLMHGERNSGRSDLPMPRSSSIYAYTDRSSIS